MKIIIAGRTQTGKTTFANKLAEKFGLTVLKTCTTRPKRSPNEDTYHFYTQEEYEAIPLSERFTETTGLDGYSRWTNRADAIQADIAILDPIGIPLMTNLWHKYGHKVILIYISVQKDLRAYKAIYETKIAPSDFDVRDKKEDDLFTSMESRLQSGRSFIFNIDGLIQYHNTMLPGSDESVMDAIEHFLNTDDGTETFTIPCNVNHTLSVTKSMYSKETWAALCALCDTSPEYTIQISLSVDSVTALIKGWKTVKHTEEPT